MAASCTTCNVVRSRTGESQFVRMQILSRSGEDINKW